MMLGGDKGDSRSCVNIDSANSIAEDLTTNNDSTRKTNKVEKKNARISSNSLFYCILTHYVTLAIIGIISWGTLWAAWGDGWRWDGPYFRLTAVALLAWVTGLCLEACTTLPPLLAALVVGIAARNLDILDIREFPEIDGFLRKIYPVIILGKGSLGWNLSYMKSEWKQVAALGIIPWSLEVATLATCTHFLLGFPWLWGIMLGTFYASVSCPVLMPSVIKLNKQFGSSVNWPQLYCTGGGLETLHSVGVYGIVSSYIFLDVDETYRLVKAASTLFAGVAVGAAWGSLAAHVPHAHDDYVTPLRVLHVLLGGLFLNFFTLRFGWGGLAGVAVLVCNATAAMHWARDTWPLNQNPASVTYRVLWSACEPTLFAFTGSYFVLSSRVVEVLPLALGILAACLAVRLTAAAAVSWRVTSVREKIFVCCLWTPKTIVEAVICPLALNTLILKGVDQRSKLYDYAEDMVLLTVVAIFVTTPLAYLLVNCLGPVLLSTKNKDEPMPKRASSISVIHLSNKESLQS